jgi:hypothetical protein
MLVLTAMIGIPFARSLAFDPFCIQLALPVCGMGAMWDEGYVLLRANRHRAQGLW